MAAVKRTEAAEPVMEAAQPKKSNDVEIRLFKDNHEYKDDVFVGINGKTWLIPRGVSVVVPREVADVVLNAERQRNEAYRYMDNMEHDFLAAEKKYMG